MSEKENQRAGIGKIHKCKARNWLNIKGRQNISHANHILKKTGMGILHKRGYKVKSVIKHKGHFNDKGITTINICACKNRTLKYMREILTEMKTEIGSSTVIT